MPFDDRDSGLTARTGSRGSQRGVALWLFGICAMLLIMIALGGATRLTGSGLSIMEWAPLSGVLPPLSHADWVHLYDLYKQIPQYALVNDGMDLDGFRHIFWLEWTHRLWGRLIGLAVAGPLLWFWATGRICRKLAWRLGFFVLLGGLQGAVGWFMVASGFFPDSTSVSPIRLVVHLVLALVLYVAILWTALSSWRADAVSPVPKSLRRLLQGAALLVGLTIVAGGFMAGTHAGLDYNTFPLMDGHLFPAEYARLTPWLRNLTENIPAVQFDHRLLATLSLLTCLTAMAVGLRNRVGGAARAALLALGAAVALQYALGVATLLLVVPVGLATLHQATAVLLLTALVTALHVTHPAPGSVR